MSETWKMRHGRQKTCVTIDAQTCQSASTFEGFFEKQTKFQQIEHICRKTPARYCCHGNCKPDNLSCSSQSRLIVHRGCRRPVIMKHNITYTNLSNQSSRCNCDVTMYQSSCDVTPYRRHRDVITTRFIRRVHGTSLRSRCRASPLSRLLCVLTVLCLHSVLLSEVHTLDASYICSRIPGLAPRQRAVCQSHPDAMVAVGEGTKLGIRECRHQFRANRWNCSGVGLDSFGLGHLQPVGSKETAFVYSMRSAAVAFSVTQGCSLGNLTSCGCDQSKLTGQHPVHGWKWGGCSADVKYGLTFSRVFLDSREIEEDTSTLVNLHNNRAGRKAVVDTQSIGCKCHGMSGSCTVKTCWVSLPSIRAISDRLAVKYSRARRVVPIRGRRAMTPIFLKLRRSTGMEVAKPPRRDLVFLRTSPNYCHPDNETGTSGTAGRECNRTTEDGQHGSCDELCCGRGYNTHVTVDQWQCMCRFHWCCYVTCKLCSEPREENFCK